jgi:hypothetical protein
LSDYFLAIMFARFFFLMRTIFNHSIYTDAFFKKLCREYGFNPGVRFTLKCYLATNPGETISILFITTLLIIAYIFRIFESPFLNDWSGNQESPWNQYFDSIYLIIVTITTVGYGDISPKTSPGKMLICVSAIWGAFMISLVVVTVSSVFELKKNQLKALKHIQVTRSAAKTIILAIKFYQVKKRYYKTKQILDPELKKHSDFIKLSSRPEDIVEINSSIRDSEFVHL